MKVEESGRLSGHEAVTGQPPGPGVGEGGIPFCTAGPLGASRLGRWVPGQGGGRGDPCGLLPARRWTGRVTVPRDVRILSPEPVTVPLRGRWDFADVVKLRILGWEGNPGVLGSVCPIYSRGPLKGGRAGPARWQHTVGAGDPGQRRRAAAGCWKRQGTISPLEPPEGASPVRPVLNFWPPELRARRSGLLVVIHFSID